MKTSKDNSGFAALTLVLSVVGILLGLVFTSSIESGLFFDQALHKEYREMNYYYAYNCLDQAILRLAHDYFLEISTPLEIPEQHCSILSVTKKGSVHEISTRGDFMKNYVYRRAKVMLYNHSLEVVSID